LPEPSLVADVRPDVQHARVALTHHLEVDHAVADPDVGEQAPVAVTLFRIKLEAHASTARQCPVDPHRRLAAARPIRVVVGNLGGIDADVADALQTIADPHVDRVAILDVDHHTLADGGWLAACGGGRARRDEREELRRKPERGPHDDSRSQPTSPRSMSKL